MVECLVLHPAWRDQQQKRTIKRTTTRQPETGPNYSVRPAREIPASYSTPGDLLCLDNV